jgi:peptidoglycan/xylan/chitin deacetylase (PgdA/CDA1 family)
MNFGELTEAVIAAVWTPDRSAGVSVLMYHYFHPENAGTWTVTTPTLSSQLLWLAAHHYTIQPLREVVSGLQSSPATVIPHAVAITVDDGEASVYTEMFPLIKRFRIPVTLFVYTSVISSASKFLTWDQLREMVDSGLVDVQSHTLTHPWFQKERERRSRDDFCAFLDAELRQSREILGKRLGVNADLLAWPYGIHDAELEAAASQAGYVAAFGVKYRPECATNPFALPRVNIAERHRGNRLGVRLARAGQIVSDGSRWLAAP